MKLYRRHEAVIQDLCHSLPEDLNQTNSVEAAVTILDQEYGMPGTLLRKVNLP